MCESHRLSLFLANPCLPESRGPPETRHIDFIWIQQGLDPHPRGETHSFALPVDSLEKEIG